MTDLDSCAGCGHPLDSPALQPVTVAGETWCSDHCRDTQP